MEWGLRGVMDTKTLFFQTREFCLYLYANSKGEEEDEGKS